ncbi:MAG: putative cell survival pathways protein [Cirrosporium novae-zelandiae]|nr:MAG: putative cell survival pathways protein [Cirrosporium novae-zelandiae]
MNWVRQQLANVAGTQEPIHGADALKSVTEQTKTTPYTELTKDHLKWATLEVTSVETQTFYVICDSGHVVMVQVIYSNVAGVQVTCQFNCKVTYPDRTKPNLWSSDPLEGHGFDEDKLSFYADMVSIDLDDDAKCYTIKSAINEDSIVDVNFTRSSPGFQVGKDGTTIFGTDPENPWGTMRHAFWPRCRVEGSILTRDGEVDLKGTGIFIYALQGMKPHHAAARWNFVNYQSPTYSAIMMEYITPASYGDTVVNVGGIVKDGEIIYAGTTNSVEHTASKHDEESGWPEPTAVKCQWNGKTKDGKELHAELSGELEDRSDRVDVMVEVPGWVKSIIVVAAGTKPYIYQYCPQATMTLDLKIGDDKKEDQGTLYYEGTFIS